MFVYNFVEKKRENYPQISVADPVGVQAVRSTPPLELNYFIFMVILEKNEAKLRKRTPLLNLYPLSRNPGSTPEFSSDSYFPYLLCCSFQTGRSGLIVQTLAKLLLEEQSDQESTQYAILSAVFNGIMLYCKIS